MAGVSDVRYNPEKHAGALRVTPLRDGRPGGCDDRGDFLTQISKSARQALAGGGSEEQRREGSPWGDEMRESTAVRI